MDEGVELIQGGINMIDPKNPCIEFTEYARCDKCGHRAYFSAEKENLLLTFCSHHGQEYNSALKQDGWKVTLDTIGYSSLVKEERIPVSA
jgi:hypothetical protein